MPGKLAFLLVLVINIYLGVLLIKYLVLIDHEGKVSAKYPNKEKMSPDMRVRVDEKWKKIVTSTIGYKTYEEMRAGINKELNRDFS